MDAAAAAEEDRLIGWHASGGPAASHPSTALLCLEVIFFQGNEIAASTMVWWS